MRAAVARIRRHRRRAGIKRELLEYFDESLFFRNVYAPDEFAMIRLLGERMRAKGLVDDAYIEGGVERAGKQPVLAPGESFEYSSWCPLKTSTGVMHGTYQMVSESGDQFDIEIAPFALKARYTVH